MSGAVQITSEGRPVQSVTLVIADRRPLVLRGLESICSREPALDVVASCEHGDATLEALRALNPDVLILDATLPPIGGVGVLRQMRREKLPTRTVLLSDHAEERHVVEALRLGVDGILFRDMTPESLLRCVRTVHAGEQWFDAEATAKLRNRRPRGEPARGLLAGALTPRQIEIVRLATEAISTREIAARLLVTEGTVKVHLHNIYEKLQVDGRVRLVLLVMEQGLP
jgi:DNA-binding NarL/FixJ family response regulator